LSDVARGPGQALGTPAITLDGRLYADDYFAIDLGFLAQGSPGTANRTLTWSLGDFNFDSRIVIDDYFLIDTAYARQSRPLSAQSAPTAMPEPVPMTPASLPDLFGGTPIGAEDDALDLEVTPTGVL
jgi:hypothetical protein